MKFTKIKPLSVNNPFKLVISFNSIYHLYTPRSPSLLQNYTSVSDLSHRTDPTALAAALTFSSKIKPPVLGNQFHAQIIKFGLAKCIFTQNNLLVMYSKCGFLSFALKVFDEMPERNLVSWTSMISGTIQNGEFEMGLELYLEMIRSGFRPNEFALASVMRGCASMEAVEFGSSLHCFVSKIGFETNLFVGSSILYMYAKCRDIEMAERVFECMKDCDVACWNAMVGGYAFNGYSYEVMKLVSLMHRKGITADQFTFTSALKGCSISGDSNFGQQIHGLIIQNGMEFSLSPMNSLIDMYFKAGRRDSSLMVFNNMKQRDVLSWNTVISGCAQNENTVEAVVLFSKMLSTGLKPNPVTFSILFRLCGVVVNLALGLQFYCLAYHLGLFINAIVVNALIEMFSKCGVIENACFVFESLPDRNIIIWNEMIAAYNSNDFSGESLRLFCNLHELGIRANAFTYSSVLGACSRIGHHEMGIQIHSSIVKSGFDSNCFVCSSLINAYARFGLVNYSFKIFQGIEVLDLVTWGAMIAAFSQQGLGYRALELLNRLRESGGKLDEFILGSALNACANISTFNQTKCIHLHVIKTAYEKQSCVASAVIDAYAKCGDIVSSRMAFDHLSRDDDPILFNTMISAYAQHGLIMEAIEIFEKMKQANLQPNHATFVSVISACSHMGLVDQGRGFFDSIRSDYGMNPSPENFGSFIDLLARYGYLHEAKYVIEDMPFEPWPAVWRSLLSGCRIHGNRHLGEFAAERILQLIPNNDAAYALLSKVYSEEGSWEDVAKVRKRMKEKLVQKEIGYSWIEI